MSHTARCPAIQGQGLRRPSDGLGSSSSVPDQLLTGTSDRREAPASQTSGLLLLVRSVLFQLDWTACSRMLPSVIGGPSGCLGLRSITVPSSALLSSYPRVAIGAGGGAIIYFTPIEKMLTLPLELPVYVTSPLKDGLPGTMLIGALFTSANV
jgi:hypothetical protein